MVLLLIVMIGVGLGILGICFSYFGVFMLGNSVLFMYEWEFKNMFYSEMEFVFFFDWLGFMFSGLVMLISSMIMLYSVWYMSGDLMIKRFIYLVLMFVFSMLMVILSPNLISILFGWDGLGLVSYCLIIYYNNWSSYVSGMITVMFNRLGDIGILLSIGYMLGIGDWNMIVFLGEDYVGGKFILGLFIILAGMTKSAQIPFCSWLPIAMAAPTPVSSLVHSSTLVTAGVYLLIRYSELLGYLGFMSLMLVGILTMILSGMVANYEYDLSSVIALSTLSQLGLMFFTVSLGMIGMAFFHLVMHALFKAMLFMCSGILIHSMGGLQDIRYMGGLYKNMPEILLLILVSSFSLMGVPFFMGFYSKDLIMEVCMMRELNLFVWLMLMISVSLTVSYTVRIYVYIVFGVNNYLCMYMYSEGISDLLIVSSWILMFLIVIMGKCMLNIMFPYLNMIILGDLMSGEVIFFLLMGVISGLFLYSDVSCEMSMVFLKMKIYFFFIFLGNFIYMPSLSLWGSLSFMNIGYFSIKIIDKGWLELFGGQGLFGLLMFLGFKVQWFQEGELVKYFTMFVFLMLVIFMSF
uniref:NADH-ubiquinone oxidoreductase chain 5 n=1 Tax=Aposthonia japonica TaxID=911381 RepID=H7CD22_9NEOP|nr:NADH dehydrogenase subunit 5 [Aposthonia japonica]